jgi:hypothetical protein
MPQPSITVLDSGSVERTVFTPNPNGQGTMANSQPVALASDQSAIPVTNAGITTIAAAVAANKMATTTADGDSATLGAKADASAGADTGTFSLIAFVKWIASKIKAVGQAAMAGSHPVVIASDQSAVAVKTGMGAVSQEIIRPSDTTAYAAADVVGPTGGAAVGVLADLFSENGGTGYLSKVELFTDQSANVAGYRVYFFNTAPTAIADNSPFTLLYADAAKYIGFVDIFGVATEGAGSTGASGLWTGQLAAKAAAADNDLYYVIVTKTAFTPASAQKVTIKATMDRNG